ncbi:MAG: hypothetical protein AB1679_14665 [Actinomycetota bacterium]
MSTMEDLAVALDDLRARADAPAATPRRSRSAFSRPWPGRRPTTAALDAGAHLDWLERLQDAGATWAMTTIEPASPDGTPEVLARYRDDVTTLRAGS